MKNTLTTFAIILALICVSQIWAQDNQANELASEPQVEQAYTDIAGELSDRDDSQESKSSGSSIKIDLDLDGDESDKDAIKKLTTVIKQVAGEDVANEVVLELEGLSEEEKNEIREAFAHGFPTEHIPGWVGAVAILAILLIFGAPVWILLVVFVFGARKRKQKMQLIQMYLDSDKDVPQQVLETFGQPTSSFRSGVMLSAVGLGILAAFSAAGDESVGALGLIPLFIGIAKLVYWFLEERTPESS